MKQKSSFTMIELLVVLAIIGLVLGISAPAINSAIKKAKVSEGTKLIYKVMEYAGNFASGHGTGTMVVFATSNLTSGDGTAYRAYKVYVPGTGPFNGTVEDWQFLPLGAVVDSDSSISTVLQNTQSINFPDDDSATQASVAYVNFGPEGTAKQTASVHVIDAGDSSCFRYITYQSTGGGIRIYGLGEEP